MEMLGGHISIVTIARKIIAGPTNKEYILITLYAFVLGVSQVD
jgi:hypothetical protein